MSTYIDKNTLYGKVDDLIHQAGEKGESITLEILARKIVPLIVSIPAQDVQPVTHAKWMECAKYNPTSIFSIYECSICGKTIRVYEGHRDWNYCPHCGAKMDADEKEKPND